MQIKTIVLSLTLLVGTSALWSQSNPLGTPQKKETKKVTDQELSNFADAYMEIQSQNQEMQQKAVKTIQDQGMKVQRFNEIASGEKDPNKEVEMSEKEKEKMVEIRNQLQKMQAKFQKNIAGMIEQKGLTVQRYQEINRAVQQDKGLQEKLQNLIKG